MQLFTTRRRGAKTISSLVGLYGLLAFYLALNFIANTSSLAALIFVPIVFILFPIVVFVAVGVANRAFSSTNRDHQINFLIASIAIFVYNLLLFSKKTCSNEGDVWESCYVPSASTNMILITASVIAVFGFFSVLIYFAEYYSDTAWKCMNLDRFGQHKFSFINEINFGDEKLFVLRSKGSLYYAVSGYHLTTVESVVQFVGIDLGMISKNVEFIRPSNDNGNTYPNEYCTNEDDTGNLVYLIKLTEESHA